jgi:hypothetical protein
MALKPDMNVRSWETEFFLNQTAARGTFLVATTGTPGSGAAMDSFNQLADVAVNPSGRYPLGVLNNEFVNVDLTRTRLLSERLEVQVGNRASIIRVGEITTNSIVPNTAAAVTIGQPAYLGASGLISSVQAQGAPAVGQFRSRPDEDGYVKVRIDF